MLDIPLQPFITPNFVSWDKNTNDSKYSNGVDLSQSTSFSLSVVSAEKLSGMCDEFRAKIFEKAAKKDPKNK